MADAAAFRHPREELMKKLKLRMDELRVALNRALRSSIDSG